MRRLLRDERGGSLVETALSFLLMLLLMFGVIEGSLAVYSYHFLANAAHEGTRYAIVRGGGWGSACTGYASSGCIASTTDVANYVASRNFPGVNIVAANVCVQYLTATPGSATSACTASTTNTNNRPGDIVQVTVNYPFKLSIPGVPLRTINMASTSQMVIAN
ncbi:MAG TPA: TadE/TadG family type IV pilus assembly protein [Terracidiphilus sp.]